MKEFLGKIRTPQNHIQFRSKCLFPWASCFLEFLWESFQNIWITGRQPSRRLHLIGSAMDLHNFLGELAPRIVIAVCIAVYSTTPIRAGINVFIFFAGMVSSYY